MYTLRGADVSQRNRQWRVPAGLIALGLVPGIAGTRRLGELASGAARTPANERFFDTPAPVVAHIVGAVLFSFVGALQFVPSLRRRPRRWHRVTGRLLVPAGFMVSLSGLWMTHGYDLPPADGTMLMITRDVVGVAMTAWLVMGVVAVRRRRFVQHGEWMMRAYAIGLGAGTQVLTHIPWFVAFGEPTETPRAFLMLAGWLINVAVAEQVIRRQRRARHGQSRAKLMGTDDGHPDAHHPTPAVASADGVASAAVSGLRYGPDRLEDVRRSVDARRRSPAPGL
jgi:hypothetical protein